MNKIKDWTVELLFPVMCVGCGKEGKYICDDCKVFISESALICPVCQKTSLTGQKHKYCHEKNSLAGLVGIWDYEGIIKELIFKIKYSGAFYAIQETVKNTFSIIADDELRFSDFLSFVGNKNTVITYVPLHRKKEKRRGFNQAKIIAEEVGKITELKVENLLEKIRETESQTELDIKERLENVKGSFALLRHSLNREIPKNVLVVDDIWTTGATMKECCRVLKTGGVKNVWGFTLARTP